VAVVETRLYTTGGKRLAGYCSVLCFCRIFYILFLKQLGSNAVVVSCQVGRTEVEIWTFCYFYFLIQVVMMLKPT